jgi:serine/threonine protein phosphatase PrpC
MVVQLGTAVSSCMLLYVCRALGDAGHKAPRRLVESEPDVNRIALKEGGDRFLVLGSDGLFDVMTDEQVVAVVNGVLTQNGEVNGMSYDVYQCPKFVSHAYCSIRAEAKAFAAADALVRQALARRTRDNVTAAVMLFDWQSDHSCHA